YVPRHRRTAALARDLVDLVDAHDAALGLVDVAAGVAVERLDHALDVFTDVARFGQRGRVRDGERDVELLGERLREQRLAAARGTEQEHVALLHFHFAGLALLLLTDAFVVVVHGDAERLLGARLTDAVLVELLGDLFRTRILRTLLRFFLRDDVVAQRNALVADEDARPRDQLADLAPALAAEGAVEVIHHDHSSTTRGRVPAQLSSRGPPN